MLGEWGIIIQIFSLKPKKSVRKETYLNKSSSKRNNDRTGLLPPPGLQEKV